MIKTTIRAADWQGLLENGAPNLGRLYTLDPNVAGRHIVFDLANENPTESVSTRKQVTNRMWYERHKHGRIILLKTTKGETNEKA